MFVRGDLTPARAARGEVPSNCSLVGCVERVKRVRAKELGDLLMCHTCPLSRFGAPDGSVRRRDADEGIVPIAQCALRDRRARGVWRREHDVIVLVGYRVGAGRTKGSRGGRVSAVDFRSDDLRD